MAASAGGQLFIVEEVGVALDGSVTPTRFEWSSAEQSAPVDGWQWEFEKRTSRRDYGDDAVEQIVGTNFKPSTLHGRWDDIYMGSGRAFTTMQAFEAFVAQSRRVRVQFGRLVLFGVLKNLKVNYKYDELIHYEFTLSPHTRDTGSAWHSILRTASVPPPSTFAANARATADKVAAIIAAAPRKQMVGSFLSGAAQDVVAMQLAADSVLAELDAQTSLAFETVESNLRVANGFSVIRSSAAIAVGNVMATRTADVVAWQSATGLLEVEAWKAETVEQAIILALIADDAQREVARRAVPKARRPYRPRKGETAVSVSVAIYGTPDQAQAIEEINGMTGLVFDGSELLILPEDP